MTVVARRIYLILAALTVIAGGLSLGILAGVRISTRDTPEFAFGVAPLSDGGFASITSAIDVAKDEVLVCARQFSSKTLIESLARASERGVKVKVLLDMETNNDPSRGALGYLRARKIGDVRTSAKPLYAQYIVIDRETVYFTSAPWAPAVADPSIVAPAFGMRSVGAAADLVDNYAGLYSNAKQQ